MKIISFIVILIGCFHFAYGQLTPHEAIQKMQRGINIGNSLDAFPTETSWGNAAIQKHYFDDYVQAGFTSVRIPITWKTHVSKTPPFLIDQNWLNRVDTVVTWALNAGLIVTINIHHESGLKIVDKMTDPLAKQDTLAKYDSIWSQISKRFKDKPDNLLFEMINEPESMSQATLEAFNNRILNIIRKTNPTRIVLYSGTGYSGSDQLIVTKIPDTTDKYLMAYFHSYDPWSFAGEAKGTFGTTNDINTIINKFTQIKNWSDKHNIPVVLNEFGAVKQCDYNSRMLYYFTFVEQSLKNNIAFNAWDDNGNFQIYIRNERKWNDIKDILMYTYQQSPNHLKATIIDNYIQLTWKNRNISTDSIVIERRTNNTQFLPIAKLFYNVEQFTDTNVINNTTYYYRIKTNIADSIKTIYSYPISIKYIKPNIIYENNQTKYFTLYPNPASTKIFIQKSKFDLQPTQVKIHNFMGQIIKSTIIEGKTISVNDLKKGIYIFTLKSGKQIENIKVTIE